MPKLSGKLTQTVVAKAKLEEKPYFIWAGEPSGFGVRVFPNGSKIFYLDYRNDHGTRRRMRIGAYGKELTVEQAHRKAASMVSSIVGESADPMRDKRDARAAVTVSSLCDAYMAAAEAGTLLKKNGERKKTSTLEIDRGRIDRHIKPLLGSKRVAEIGRGDIRQFIKDVTAGKTAKVVKTDKLRGKAIVEGGAGTAARTTGLLSGIMSFAVDEEIIAANPVHGVPRPKDGKRDRRLTPDEMRALGDALSDAVTESWQAIAGIRLLSLTGARLSEIVKLQWSEVDLANQVLVYGDTKTGQSLRPLGSAAIDIIQATETMGGAGFVLPGARDTAKPFGSLDTALERVTAKAKLEGVTAHVLRHTFASIAADMNYSDGTIGALIGHKGHTVTSKYSHRLDAVLVAAANKVAAEVWRQMTGQGGNVVEMPRRA
ncbi:MAG: integrase [Rhizobiales bacterium]|nr:integrase [Hyphomicrobiales bacterium]|tara:strand:+ start:2224 stop:3510 length:1287 start_codon:yes stop_codon:yes gene_type:complete